MKVSNAASPEEKAAAQAELDASLTSMRLSRLENKILGYDFSELEPDNHIRLLVLEQAAVSDRRNDNNLIWY